MPTARRIEPSESYGEGAIPSNATIRYEVLNAYKASEAILYVKENEIDVGDIHPDVPGSRLQATRFRAAERIGSGNDRGWFVDVEFGVDGTGANFEEPPVTEPDYSTAEYSTLERVIKAPYFFKTPVQFPDPAGGTVVTGFDWEKGVQEFTITGLSFRAVVNVGPSDYNLGQFRVAAEQANKLHPFGQLQWQYLGADSAQVSADVWSITHEWWHDPGNPEPGPPTVVNIADLILAGPRATFEDYVSWVSDATPPGGTGAIYEPGISVYKPFIEDANGFANLPGDPIGRVS